MSERQVLVVGGAGYVGSVLTRRLLAEGDGVRVLDALIYGNGFALAGIADHERFSFLRGDVRSEDDVAAAMEGVTDVVHLAALVGDPVCKRNPEMAREVAAKMMAAVKAEQAKQTSKWTDRDRLTWEREQKRIIAEGDRLFHDWKALGGTIGISCDMCHPNGSNTHAETYPKFQTQLKKVAALRDMINWCIENPMKGKPLALDDPRILALEAYMTAQRKGVPLEPGKH